MKYTYLKFLSFFFSKLPRTNQVFLCLYEMGSGNPNQCVRKSIAKIELLTNTTVFHSSIVVYGSEYQYGDQGFSYSNEHVKKTFE